MRILVTGINGFVGHHVAERLYDLGHEVLGIGNQPQLEDNLNKFVTEYVSCDLIDPASVTKINLKNVDAIINLAGFAKVGDSKGQGELYNKVNVGVHAVLYEECLQQDAKPRIIAVSTGAVYDPNHLMPITEDSDLVPDNKTNEYVISKKLTERAVSEFNDRGLRCIITRPFNHTGPGQLPGFLLPDLAEQIEASLRTQQPLMVGNLETRRDFTDVRDVARAYVELALCDESRLGHAVYNICSGSSIPGKEILRLLINSYGAEGLETKVDPSRLRTNDVMDIYGSRNRITSDVGWEPTILTEQTIQDFVDWRKHEVEKT